MFSDIIEFIYIKNENHINFFFALNNILLIICQYRIIRSKYLNIYPTQIIVEIC